MLRTRLWMGSLLIAGFVGAIWLDGRLGPPFPCWFVGTILLGWAACRELRWLLKRRDLFPPRWLCYTSVLGAIGACWVPFALELGLNRMPVQGVARLIVPAGVFCAAMMAAMGREAIIYCEPGRSLTTLGASLLVAAYLGMLGSCVAELRWMDHGIWAIGLTVAVAKCGDTGAYFGGRLFGRHKLAPKLSPGKTIEGSVCGLAFSVLAALAVNAAGRSAGLELLCWPGTFIFGCAIGVLAPLGDLVESLIKRDCQQKDASEALPGFGGILDVIDSVLFVGPVSVLLWGTIGPGWPDLPARVAIGG